MVAATIDTLPISKPLKKKRHPVVYTIAAIGSRTIIDIGKLKDILKKNTNRKTDIKPANWDQKKDLNGPIRLA